MVFSLAAMEKRKINPEIGTMIARARLALGLTQRQFADRLGVSQGLVGAWENHTKSPGTKNLKKIADETGISMDAIASGTPSASRTLTITDADEIRLITLFRRLPKMAKHNSLQLIEMAANLGRVQQKDRSPLEVE